MRTLIDTAVAAARRVVPRSSAAGDRLRRWRHSIRRQAPTRPIEVVIDAFGRLHPQASFVQVGSNDGVKFDPICLQVRTRPWTGVMVEPVPYLFERLRAHYGGSRRIRLENAAVADHDGWQPFFFLAEARPGDVVPDWYDALGSFRRDVVLSHREHIPDIEERLQEAPVPCLTFEALCRKHGLERLDLVHVDTEGYDFEIIKLIDLDRWAPTVLLFEHKHLSPEDRAACVAHLEGHGYDLLADDTDTLCLRRAALDAQPALAAAWRSAR
jgi:FkbM family methyltransferase